MKLKSNLLGKSTSFEESPKYSYYRQNESLLFKVETLTKRVELNVQKPFLLKKKKLFKPMNNFCFLLLP